MNLDKSFVLAAVSEGEECFVYAAEKGIDPEIHLYDEGKIAWEFALDYRRKYQSIPSVAIITEKTGVKFDNADPGEFRFFIEEIFNRRIIALARQGNDAILRRLDKHDIQGVVEQFSEINRKLLNENVSLSKVESLLALGKDVLKHYDNIKAGVRGIPSPWPTMNDQTMGWWPEDLIVFAGKMGAGKSFALVLLCHTAWKADNKVLFIATEMNKINIAMRFFAIHFRVPYEDLRKGRLDGFTEKKFREGVLSMLNDQGLSIVGGGFDYSIDGVTEAIVQDDSDLVGVDGAYLIKNTGKDRHERVSNTFDDLKRIAKRRATAILTNTQFNRSAKSDNSSTIASDNIGITDVAGWNADALYGMYQSDEMRDSNIMGIKPIKIREGKPSDIQITWDLDRMDFSEINSKADSDPPKVSGPGKLFGDSSDNDNIVDPMDDLPF